MSLFITFEGPEGSGKSTQARLLYGWLHARNYPAILVREPGGTRIGDMIRRIVLDLQNTEIAPTTETLLFAASRAQLVSQTIRPYLELGGIVLCDRYADSTYAYQGYGLGRDLDELRAITAAATGGLIPDVTVYLDLTAEEGLERKRLKRQGDKEIRRQADKQMLGNSQPAPASQSLPLVTSPPRAESVEWNRLDARELAYHQKVAAGYQELIAQEPQRWRIFDARQPVEELAEQIARDLMPWLEHIQPVEATST